MKHSITLSLLLSVLAITTTYGSNTNNTTQKFQKRYEQLLQDSSETSLKKIVRKYAQKKRRALANQIKYIENLSDSEYEVNQIQEERERVKAYPFHYYAKRIQKDIDTLKSIHHDEFASELQSLLKKVTKSSEYKQEKKLFKSNNNFTFLFAASAIIAVALLNQAA